MTVGRVLVGLVTTLIVEGSSIYAPLLKLNVFWTNELQLLRYVLLGVVLCGLAVTGGVQAPVKAEPKKLRLRGAPPEADPGLEAMAAAFRERLEPKAAEAPKPEKPMEAVEPVDFVGLQDEAANLEEKPVEGG